MTESVDNIDKNDNVIEVVTRAEMRKRNLLHRVSTIFVFNTAGELLIQKRTMTKDLHPGMWDASASGGVLHEESYDEAAVRELKEELGISAPLTFLFTYCYEGPTTKSLFHVYKVIYNGRFTLQKEEVSEVKFIEVKQLLKEIDQPQYAPCFRAVFKEYCRRFYCDKK